MKSTVTTRAFPKNYILGFTIWNQRDFLQGEMFKFAAILAHHTLPYLFEY